jgi:hypothetical protein
MAKVLERLLYETDYYAWTKQQAAELRAMAAARTNSTLDLENLAEEVESLGRGDLATVRSQLRRIIEHLLKLEYSPTAEPRFGWRESVIEARDMITDIMTASLARDARAGLPRTYQQARRRTDATLRRYGEREAAEALPTSCPYSFEQILDQDWYPQNRHGLADE